jgi:hypothetical protein
MAKERRHNGWTPRDEDDPDPRVTKRRVRMVDVIATPTGNAEIEQFDFVRPDHLDAYVADARQRHQLVEIGPRDAGPGGYEGQTAVPERLAVPDAGAVYPATEKEG